MSERQLIPKEVFLTKLQNRKAEGVVVRLRDWLKKEPAVVFDLADYRKRDRRRLRVVRDYADPDLW